MNYESIHKCPWCNEGEIDCDDLDDVFHDGENYEAKCDKCKKPVTITAVVRIEFYVEKDEKEGK